MDLVRLKISTLLNTLYVFAIVTNIVLIEPKVVK